MSVTFLFTLSEQGAVNRRTFLIKFCYSVHLKHYFLRCNIKNIAVWRKLLLFVSRSSYINICGNWYQNRDFGRHAPYFIEKETHNLLDTVVICRALLLRIWGSHVISLSCSVDDVTNVTVLWNVMPCSLVEMYRDFGEHLLPQSSDWYGTFPCIIGKFLLKYTASFRRRLLSS